METPPDSEEKLAKLIGYHLRQLPAPKAPRSLAPRILEAIAARQNRPWWQKSWFHWPRYFQTLFVLVTLTAVAFAGWYSTALDPDVFLNHLREVVLSQFDFAKPVVTLVVALGNALVSVARAAGQTFWMAAISVVVVIYLACVGLGTLCYRLAFSNSNQQSL